MNRMYSVTGVEKEIIAIFALSTALKEGRTIKLPSDLKGFFNEKRSSETTPKADVMYG